MTLATVVFVIGVVVALVMIKKESLSWPQVALGVVLAFLLMGTFVGPYLQELMGTAGTTVEGFATDMWNEITQ